MNAPLDSVTQVERCDATLSSSARRLLVRPRPRYRGVLHRWAALASILVGVVITIRADGTRATVALAVFSVGVFAMLATSALVHSRDWETHQVERLVRLDHSAIFLMFATTGTPLARLGLDAPASTWLLVVIWTGAVLGIVAEWLPVHPPAGIMNAAWVPGAAAATGRFGSSRRNPLLQRVFHIPGGDLIIAYGNWDRMAEAHGFLRPR